MTDEPPSQIRNLNPGIELDFGEVLLESKKVADST
jgi:hypothetical protein